MSAYSKEQLERAAQALMVNDTTWTWDTCGPEIREIHRQQARTALDAASSVGGEGDYEWAVIRDRTGEIHRGPYQSEEEAREWMWGALIASSAADEFKGRFHVARRLIGTWERAVLVPEEET